MTVKTKDLIIEIDKLTDNQTITKPKISALYFKDKTFAQAISSLDIVGNNLVITTNNNDYQIIITDYFKQNGKNAIKYIKTDEAGEVGFLRNIIDLNLIDNPNAINAP